MKDLRVFRYRQNPSTFAGLGTRSTDHRCV